MSGTWLMPPVGSGRAGMNIRSRIVTANDLSPNRSPRLPSVFGASVRSHSSSSSVENGLASGSAAPVGSE